jgi:hypothetical protein
MLPLFLSLSASSYLFPSFIENLGLLSSKVSINKEIFVRTFRVYIHIKSSLGLNPNWVVFIFFLRDEALIFVPVCRFIQLGITKFMMHTSQVILDYNLILNMLIYRSINAKS